MKLKAHNDSPLCTFLLLLNHSILKYLSELFVRSNEISCLTLRQQNLSMVEVSNDACCIKWLTILVITTRSCAANA